MSFTDSMDVESPSYNTRPRTVANYGFGPGTLIHGDAAIYQNESYRRYQDYALSIQCNIAEAKQIHDAFESGYNGNFNGGKRKMMKGGSLEGIKKIGQTLKALLIPESVGGAMTIHTDTIITELSKLTGECYKELVSFLIRNKIYESSLEYGSKLAAVLLFTPNTMIAGSLLIQDYLNQNPIPVNLENAGTAINEFSKIIDEKIRAVKKSHADRVKQQEETLRKDLLKMIDLMKEGLPGSEQLKGKVKEVEGMQKKYDTNKLEKIKETTHSIKTKTNFIRQQTALLEALKEAEEELKEAKDAQTELTGDQDGEKESADDMNVDSKNGGRKTRKGGRKCRKSRKGNCKIKVKSRKNKRRSNKKKYNKKYNKK